MKATYHTYKKENILGSNVRYFRRLRSLTQEQLAFAVYRRSRSYISAIENGLMLPSLYLLLDIAQVLKVSPALLFVDSNSDNFILLFKALKPADKTQIVRDIKRRLSLTDMFSLFQIEDFVA